MAKDFAETITLKRETYDELMAELAQHRERSRLFGAALDAKANEIVPRLDGMDHDAWFTAWFAERRRWKTEIVAVKRDSSVE